MDLASPGLGILGPTERHALVAAEVVGELPTDLHRFPFLEPVDPVA